jgi:hypothetical protein
LIAAARARKVHVAIPSGAVNNSGGPTENPALLGSQKKMGVQVGLGVPDSLTAIDLNSGT